MSTIAEFVLVGWVFGIENFLDALGEMEMDFKSGSGIMRGLGWFWRIMICGVTPIILGNQSPSGSYVVTCTGVLEKLASVINPHAAPPSARLNCWSGTLINLGLKNF